MTLILTIPASSRSYDR